MSRRWLVLDVSNLAYIAMYAFGDLSYEGAGTGAAYGIFRNLLDLTDLYSTKNVVFAFDRGHECRRKIYQGYKGDRKVRTEEQKEAHSAVARQLYRMRTRYLPAMGFRNLFWQDDYEADDIMASVCHNLRKGDEAVVVSTDEDMYQLLAPHVIIWNPKKKKPVTEESFSEPRGIGPSQWPLVKAIAGCISDDVPGVKGVGEITAIKYITGNLKSTTKAFQSIIESNNRIERNLRLVTLPFPNTKNFELVEDEVTTKKWDVVVADLGMKSLKGGWK